MSTLGIIAEYNPFHNGHQYHLLKSKELSGAEFSIAIISGHFLQRGEPAAFNKWMRAGMALSAGIDLVIEMPFVFASQDACSFAHAGIRLLDSLGIIDYVSFGCEDDEIAILSELAKLIKTEPPYFKQLCREESKKGVCFPTIRENAILKYFQKYGMKTKNISMNKAKEILNKPNNILALEYLKSLQKIKSSIKPIPIKRIGSGYLEDQLAGYYSSATAIRNQIIQYHSKHNFEVLDSIKQTMPYFSYQLILNDLNNEVNPIQLSSFEQAILFQLRKMSITELKKIHGIQEGLENRFKDCSKSSYTIESLIKSIKTKRYTRTRIQRILIHTLFNLRKRETAIFNKEGPLYCRVLGMTDNGKFLLKQIKIKSKIPVVVKLKNFYQQNKIDNNIHILKMLDYDILSTDLYVLGYQKESLRFGGQDYTKNILTPSKNNLV